MKIMIEVSDKEFGVDIQDKFQDFFGRIIAEIGQRLIMGDELVCGYFERETAEMFLNAFKNALYIHDNSINGDKINSIHIDKDFIDVYGKNETVTCTVGQDCTKELELVINKLKQKPSKLVAHWIDRSDEGMVWNPLRNRYICSNCGRHSGLENYCCNCGAEMEDEVEK